MVYEIGKVENISTARPHIKCRHHACYEVRRIDRITDNPGKGERKSQSRRNKKKVNRMRGKTTTLNITRQTDDQIDRTDEIKQQEREKLREREREYSSETWRALKNRDEDTSSQSSHTHIIHHIESHGHTATSLPTRYPTRFPGIHLQCWGCLAWLYSVSAEVCLPLYLANQCVCIWHNAN